VEKLPGIILVVVTVLIRVTSGGHSDIVVEERAMFAENAEPEKSRVASKTTLVWLRKYVLAIVHHMLLRSRS